MSNRLEIRPSDDRQGEYVAHVGDATYNVCRAFDAMEQWIATCVSDPCTPPVRGFRLQDVEAKLTTLTVR